MTVRYQHEDWDGSVDDGPAERRTFCIVEYDDYFCEYGDLRIFATYDQVLGVHVADNWSWFPYSLTEDNKDSLKADMKWWLHSVWYQTNDAYRAAKEAEGNALAVVREAWWAAHPEIHRPTAQDLLAAYIRSRLAETSFAGKILPPVKVKK